MEPHTWVEAVPRVVKPWGYEDIFALVEGGYCGKLIHVIAGQALSLQFHNRKDETISVLAGTARLEVGVDEARLDHVDLVPGQRVRLKPGVRHRITAVTDVDVLEASTADPGWREDVVRLEDRYGRTGTTAP